MDKKSEFKEDFQTNEKLEINKKLFKYSYLPAWLAFMNTTWMKEEETERNTLKTHQTLARIAIKII